MRGAQNTARLITVAVVVLSALTLIALAARSDRGPLLAPKQVAAAPTAVITEPTASPTLDVPDGPRPARPGRDRGTNPTGWSGSG